MAMLEVVGLYAIAHEDEQRVVAFTHTKTAFVALMEEKIPASPALQAPMERWKHWKPLTCPRLHAANILFLTRRTSQNEDMHCESQTTIAL
jgi:hypothetical protein